MLMIFLCQQKQTALSVCFQILTGSRHCKFKSRTKRKVQLVLHDKCELKHLTKINRTQHYYPMRGVLLSRTVT